MAMEKTSLSDNIFNTKRNPPQKKTPGNKIMKS
jgi:hypothetical protein